MVPFAAPSARDSSWMLDGAVFADPSLYPYPIRSEDWGRGCIVGGRFEGPIPTTATRDSWYDGVGARELKSQELRITMDSDSSGILFVDACATSACACTDSACSVKR